MLLTAVKRGTYLVRKRTYIPTEYLVLSDKQLVYIPIPKVACTSIKMVLVHCDCQSDSCIAFPHSVHRQANRYESHSLRRSSSKFFKFAFVRNPFDRLVSCFCDKLKKPLQHNNRYYFATRYNDVLIRRLFGNRFHENMSFEDFAVLVSRIPDWLSDGHFKSQQSFLFSRTGERIPEFIGKFENIAEDWNFLALKYELPALQMTNTTIKKTWQEFYTSVRLVETVAARFKNDIDCFGYRDQYEELKLYVKQRIE